MAVITGNDQAAEDRPVESLGYHRQLDRGVGRFGSFSVAFALISVTTAVYTTFGLGLTTAGPSFLWTFPIALAILGLWVVIAADLASKIPLAGYAYQWTSRLVSPGFGWFTGFFGIFGFVTAMAAVAFTLSGYFGGLAGWDLSTDQAIGLTIVVLALAAVVNVGGVRLVTKLNNVGVSCELVVALGGTLAVGTAAFFIHHNAQSLSFLFTRGVVPSGGFAVAWLTATVTGLFGLLGVEAAADISEETKRATSTVPRMMFLALGTAAVIEFIMYGISMLALKNISGASASPTPLIYIMHSQLGTGFTDVFVAFALTNLLLCVLANLLVAGRLIYSMSRDNMLPASKVLARISPHQVPRNAVIASAALAAAFVLTGTFSSTVLAYALGVSTITFFAVYVLTTAGILVTRRRGNFPPDTPGGFTLGRWRGAAHIAGVIAFTAVVLAFCLLHGYRNNGKAMVVLSVVAAAWYLAVLRRRLSHGMAGPPAAAGNPGTEPAQRAASRLQAGD
jgi:amino acid transporter